MPALAVKLKKVFFKKGGKNRQSLLDLKQTEASTTTMYKIFSDAASPTTMQLVKFPKLMVL